MYLALLAKENTKLYTLFHLKGQNLVLYETLFQVTERLHNTNDQSPSSNIYDPDTILSFGCGCCLGR